ncbi:MAG: WecB/TagA/CpsF family glycosyltransferase [Pseudomonadota bacterium]
MNQPLPDLTPQPLGAAPHPAARTPRQPEASGDDGFVLPGTKARLTMRDRTSLLAAIRARLAARQGFALATLNLDHLVKLRRDIAFAEAYGAHDLVTADGNPVVWLSALAGERVALVPGADLIGDLAAIAAADGTAIALIGSTSDALAAAATRLAAIHPGLQVALTLAPSPSFDPTGPEADEVIAEIGASGAPLVILALGAPKQERFAARARNALPHCGFASLGAALDFAAGHRARAPRVLRHLALEWAWRLALEPKRLIGRYLECAALLPRLTLAAIAARLGSRAVTGTEK